MVGPLTFFSYDLVPYREGEDIIVASKRVDRSGEVAEHLHTPFGGILLLFWLTTIRADRGIIPPSPPQLVRSSYSVEGHIRAGEVEPDVDPLACEGLHAPVVALGAVDGVHTDRIRAEVLDQTGV